MIDKGNKITNKEEQRHSSLDTERSDNDIYYFTNGNSIFVKHTVIVGTFIRHELTKHFHVNQRQQSLLSQTVLPIVPNSLEDFQKDQISHANSVFKNSGVKSVCFPVLDAVEVVDPNTGNVQYHWPPRISSTFPSHFTRPRSFRISCYWSNRCRKNYIFPIFV